MEEKRKFRYSSENLQKLLVLLPAFEFKMREAEKLRKEIASIKLRILK